jgi:hypothetical protein
MPIFKAGKAARYTAQEVADILCGRDSDTADREPERCTAMPVMVRRNCAFLLDLTHFASADDAKSDMNGVFAHPLRVGTWTLKYCDSEFMVTHKKKVEISDKNQYHLSIHSKKNNAGLCRSIFILYDVDGKIVNDSCLLQYHIDESVGKDVVEFEVRSHGNRKHGHKPFNPMQKSTLEQIKHSLRDGEHTSSVYNDMSRHMGGFMSAESPGQFPRSRHQIYNAKASLAKVKESKELGLYAKCKDEEIILEHSDWNDDVWVLGTEVMCSDLARFCTSTTRSYPFSVDPTFEFGTFKRIAKIN